MMKNVKRIFSALITKTVFKIFISVCLFVILIYLGLFWNFHRARRPLVSEDLNYLWFAGQQDKNVLHPKDIFNFGKNGQIIKEIGLKEFLSWSLKGTGLVPSYEGWDSCFVYDQALSAFVFTYFDDFSRAKRIFDFFHKQSLKQRKTIGYFRAFTDAYERTGKEHETWAAGPNGWLLMALNYYTYKTGDRTYFDLSKKLADWLLHLQSIDGGIIGGYYGNGLPMTWISSEHNFDCFAALRDFGRLWNQDLYLKRAKDIQFWFEHDAWNARQTRFNMGRNNKFYATDQSSWAVLSLGEKYKNTFDFAYKYSQCQHRYEVNDVLIDGFDFGSAYDTSPYPDKDAVWLEGTGHMVVALFVAGETKKAEYFLGELKKAETKSEKHKGAKGLPYATNEGTPVFGSWLMQDRPLSVAGTSWFIFAKNQFNPFCMDQKLSPANNLLASLNYEPDFHFVPIVDDFETTYIKFETSYWDEYKISQKAEIEKKWINQEDGNDYMQIIFTPETDTRIAMGKIERKFMIEQDWSPFENFTVRFLGDGSSNILKIKVKDKEGEMYEIPIFARDVKWNSYTFRLPDDFSRDRNDGVAYGNNVFDTDAIIGIAFEVTSKTSTKSILGLDDIVLKGKKQQASGNATLEQINQKELLP